MSIGIRDRLLEVYAYGANAANGRIASRYAYVASWWGRIGTVAALEGTVGTAGDHDIDAVCHFADEAVVTFTGLIRDPVDGTLFKVRGIQPRRELRELSVTCQRLVDETITLTGTP